MLISKIISYTLLCLGLQVLVLTTSSVSAITAASSSSSSSSSSNEVDMGTTLVALKFDGGVVVGADTRTSVSGYVSNKFARKINIIVNEEDISCVVCRSGSAADTQWLCHETSKAICERKWRYNQVSTVSQVANFLRYKVKEKEDQLQASLICAGCDDDTGGGRVFGIASSGTLWEEDVFCVSGSGSTMLLGHLDSLKLTKDDLYSEDKAVELVQKLLKLSIARDGSSGGMIRLVIMKKGHGLKEVTVYPEAPEKVAPELPGFANAKEVTTQ